MFFFICENCYLCFSVITFFFIWEKGKKIKKSMINVLLFLHFPWSWSFSISFFVKTSKKCFHDHFYIFFSSVKTSKTFFARIISEFYLTDVKTNWITLKSFLFASQGFRSRVWWLSYIYKIFYWASAPEVSQSAQYLYFHALKLLNTCSGRTKQLEQQNQF